jgi:hypothetical protein
MHGYDAGWITAPVFGALLPTTRKRGRLFRGRRAHLSVLMPCVSAVSTPRPRYAPDQSIF